MFAVNDDEEMLKKSTDRPTDRLNVIFALQLALFITFPFYSFNFSGLPSCHSCRVFFYRNAPKKEKLKCLKEGACLLDFVTRKCCSFCRLSRCFEIGMKVKEEKDAKNGGRGRGRAGGGGGKRRSGGKSTEIEREVEKETAFLETSSSSFSSPLSSSEGSSSHDKSPVSSSPQEGVLSTPLLDKTSSSSTSTSLDSTLREILINLNKMPLISVDVNPKMSTLTRAPSLMPPPPPPPPPLPQTLELNPFERAQLAELRSYSSHFPEETDLEVVPMTMTCAEGFNLSSNYARRGVKYCKQIPFFRTLSREDQLRLLKPTMFESMTIRAAFFYNKDRDTYMMLENEEGTRVVEVKVLVH
ncbi:zinc ion binding [Tyrophagus putrescentiae]|nr:zinc ion binding [Tyrophagus putrescentiae]